MGISFASVSFFICMRLLTARKRLDGLLYQCYLHVDLIYRKDAFIVYELPTYLVNGDDEAAIEPDCNQLQYK